MIRKLKTGEYRLYSRKVDRHTRRRRNLGTFGSRAAAEKHEASAVQDRRSLRKTDLIQREHDVTP